MRSTPNACVTEVCRYQLLQRRLVALECGKCPICELYVQVGTRICWWRSHKVEYEPHDYYGMYVLLCRTIRRQCCFLGRFSCHFLWSNISTLQEVRRRLVNVGHEQCSNHGRNVRKRGSIFVKSLIMEHKQPARSVGNGERPWIASICTIQITCHLTLNCFACSQFLNCKLFNSDLSDWDVSRLSDAASMFREAGMVIQNLCSWGTRLAENVKVTDMFSMTNCSEQGDPSTDDIARGPFCAKCG
jgi:Mycoplasma protein of unknown function, DUF285